MSGTVITELYPVEFLIKGARKFTLWYTEDVDGFLLNENKKIKVFPSREEAAAFAQANGFKVSEERTEISLDMIPMLEQKIVDCNAVLTCWNILSDAALSVGRPFLGDCRRGKIQRIYSKLFYGCNLPAVKGDGEDFEPVWSEGGMEKMMEVIREGEEILLEALEG